MKRILLLAAVLLMAVSCGKDKSPKVLVLYYSQTGNTKAVAEAIQSQLGADIEAIVPVNPYDGDFQATIERGKKELDSGFLPEIEPLKSDIQSYDVIFVGYPVWFGTFAQPIATLLADGNFKGKRVVPFCTFGSGGLFSSAADIAKKQPEAEVLPGYGVRAARMMAMPEEVDQFLKANGFLEGDYVKLEEFPETHAASEEESAIFDAAVEGYSMLSATASKVASRKIPGGTEYQFIALTAPRQATPESKMVEITVYVAVKDGEAPVFTQVVR